MRVGIEPWSIHQDEPRGIQLGAGEQIRLDPGAVSLPNHDRLDTEGGISMRIPFGYTFVDAHGGQKSIDELYALVNSLHLGYG